MRKIEQIILIHFLIFLFLNNAQSQEPALDSAQPQTIKSNDSTYAYIAEGRPDPFKPFVSQKSSTAADPNEIVDEQTHLTGMQLYEPGQLTLVGVIVSSNESMALVEDQTKKGYVLKLGNLIGKRGVVTSIENDKVVITETAKTRSGKEMKTVTTMKMKRDGDE